MIFLADMPTFMLNADRIVGGEAAPSPVPWQVAVLSGSFQFCGATILDASTILCAAHCKVKTSHSIRAGSVSRSSGGQVCFYEKIRFTKMYILYRYVTIKLSYVFLTIG